MAVRVCSLSKTWLSPGCRIEETENLLHDTSSISDFLGLFFLYRTWIKEVEYELWYEGKIVGTQILTYLEVMNHSL